MAFDPKFRERQSNEPQHKLNMATFKLNIKSMWALVIGGGVVTWILLTDGIRDIAFSLTDSLEPIFQVKIGGLSEQMIGNLRAVSSITWIGASLISGWITDKYESRLSIAIGFFMQFASALVFINAESLAGFVVSRAFFGAAFGFMFPAYDALIGKVIPDHMRGIAYGLFWTSISVFALPAPYLGSYMWDSIGPRSPFIVVVAISFLVGIVAWFKLKPDEKELVTPTK